MNIEATNNYNGSVKRFDRTCPMQVVTYTLVALTEDDCQALHSKPAHTLRPLRFSSQTIVSLDAQFISDSRRPHDTFIQTQTSLNLYADYIEII